MLRTMNQLPAVALVTTIALSMRAAPAQADCSQAVAHLRHTVGEAIEHHTSFTSLVVSPHNPHNTIAVHELMTANGNTILNPLTVRCGGRLLGYIGRRGISIVVEIAASQAQLTERIGPDRVGQQTIPVRNPLTAGLVSSRRLRPGDVYGSDVSGFVAGHEVFGAALPVPM